MSGEKGAASAISRQALSRMPYYLQHLKRLSQEGVSLVSAPCVADAMGLNEVQVRKDFAAVSTTHGKPRSGFVVKELIADMEAFLGYQNVADAVLVGAGSLGRALLSYKGFDHYGLNITAAFDCDQSLWGSEINKKKIMPADRISEICRRLNVHIGIITVPAEAAQTVCDQLVAGGILAIWNFSQARLFAPENILIKNENMAASLALLSNHLKETLKKQKPLPQEGI